MSNRIFAICIIAIWFLPAVGHADYVCQKRKSKRIMVAAQCPSGFQPVFDLGPLLALGGQIDALKAELAGIDTTASELDAAITGVGINVNGLAAAANTRIAALERSVATIRDREIPANSIDSTNVEDNSLGLVDMASSLTLPFPSNVVGNHARTVSAEIDMSTADGNSIGVIGEAGLSWLSIRTFDPSTKTADFVIDPDVFADQPRCVAGVTGGLSPDSARSLVVQIVDDDVAGLLLRVRVHGPDRQLDVTGNVICTGAAKL